MMKSNPLEILILFGANSSLEWGRSFQWAKSLSRLGHKLTYINLPSPILSVQGVEDHDAINIYTPKHGLPCGKFPFLRSFNNKLIYSQIDSVIRHYHKQLDLVWIYSPYSPEIISKLKKKHQSAVFLYDCGDERVNYANLHGGPRLAAMVKDLEIKVLKQVDCVISITQNIIDIKKQYNANIYLMPNGIDQELFNKDVRCPVPCEYQNVKEKIILYLGTVEKWVDVDLMVSLAKECFPHKLFIVGSVNCHNEKLKSQNNIVSIGTKPYRTVPAYIQHADLCIIPFISNGMIKYSNTLKSLQYLAMHKPVISTYYDGVKDYSGLIKLARCSDEFIDIVKSILSGTAPVSDYESIQSVLDQYSWDRLANEVLNLADVYR